MGTFLGRTWSLWAGLAVVLIALVSVAGAAGETSRAHAGAAVRDTTLPTWSSNYDWANGDGYVGWHTSTSSASDYGLEPNLGGNYGLWLWPQGGRHAYTQDDFAEWTYTAPGTTRLLSATLSFAYRNKLLAHHCIDMGFRTLDGTVITQQEYCQPVHPPDSQSLTNVALADPASNPTSKVLYLRIRVDCGGASTCARTIPELDPLGPGGYVRFLNVDMTLVDDDNPTVYPSNTFANLTYINGTQSYPLTIGADDAGGGIVRNWAERVGDGAILSQDAPCDPTHNTEELDSRICPASFVFTGSVDTSPLPEGRNDFVAKSVDVAGNIGVSAPWSVLIDRTGPSAPTSFDIWSYDPGTHEAQVEWDANATDPDLPTGEPGSGVAGAQYRYQVNGGGFTDWTDPDAGADTQTPGFTVPNANLGDVIDVEVREIDNVGNAGAVGSASLTVTDETNQTDLPLGPPAVADGGSTAFFPAKPDWAPEQPPMINDDTPEDSTVTDVDFSPLALVRTLSHRVGAAIAHVAHARDAIAHDVSATFSASNPCGLGAGDTPVGGPITVSATLHAQQYTHCIVFWTSADRNWTVYTTCVQQQDGDRRRGVGPGYIGVMRDESSDHPLLVNDLRWRRNGSSTFKDIGSDAAFWNVGNLGAANGGLGTFEVQYARGNPPQAWAGAIEWLPDGKLPNGKLGGKPNLLGSSGVQFESPEGFIGERLCSDELVPGNPAWGVYKVDSHVPTTVKGTIRYQVEVWLKDPWSQSSSPEGRAVIGVQHLYRFTAGHVQEIVSAKTFAVPAADPGVPLVKEPKIGVTLRGNGDYNRIRYYVQADGAERLIGFVRRGQPEWSPWTDANHHNHNDSLNTMQDAPANRFKVEWGDAAACNGRCFDVLARAMKPLWIQAGSTLDPFNRDRILWAQQSLGLNGWALASAARDSAYVRDTSGGDVVTNCSADPALRGHRTDYPQGNAGLAGWLAHLTTLSQDANPAIPEVRRWEIGGWKNGLTTGQRDSDLPYTGSFVLFHGWEGAEGPKDCEPLMVTLGSGVYTNFLDFSFR